MKKIRIALALIVFCLITFYFLDFADLIPNKINFLTKVQFVPALFSLSVGMIIFILVITFLFGRIYCSVICPLGVFQDFFEWFSKKIIKKKKYPYRKNNPVLRWTIVGVLVITFIAGTNVLVSILDPYSMYGRIATHLFKPVYLFANNIIAAISNYYKNYTFYNEGIFLTGIVAFIIAVISFLIIGFLAYKYGRLYCNTICPVGTVLGFISKYSLLKIKIGGENCNSCGLCGMKCKASCIDTITKEVDYSRCVSCFNCLEECHRNALKWDFSFNVKKKEKKSAELIQQNNATVPFDENRRKFFVALLSLFTLSKLFAARKDSTNQIKEIFTSHNVPFKRKHAITPPGSKNVNHFNDKCTACHLCISKCPSQVLKATFLEYGIIGMMQPAMTFEHGYCNYHCTVCTEVCPAKALEPITEKEKKTLQIGQVQYIKENCVVVTDGTDCGACSEHCPTQAVSMQPYKGDLRIPTINHDLCVGCGACEYICPVRPFRAIYVEGNPTHLHAKIEEGKVQKIEVKDFGF